MDGSACHIHSHFCCDDQQVEIDIFILGSSWNSSYKQWASFSSQELATFTYVLKLMLSDMSPLCCIIQSPIAWLQGPSRSLNMVWKAHKRFPRRQSDEILFKYCIIPQSTTGHSPSDLLFGRWLCSNLNLLHPNLNFMVCQKQNSQKQTHDYHAQ